MECRCGCGFWLTRIFILISCDRSPCQRTLVLVHLLSFLWHKEENQSLWHYHLALEQIPISFWGLYGPNSVRMSCLVKLKGRKIEERCLRSFISREHSYMMSDFRIIEVWTFWYWIQWWNIMFWNCGNLNCISHLSSSKSELITYYSRFAVRNVKKEFLTSYWFVE